MTTKPAPNFGWAGMLGPALFTATFTLEGWLRPGYRPAGMFVSALSLGPRGWVQISNFLVFGALLFTFARTVDAALGDGGSRAGAVILRVLALGFFASGPFVMDPVGTPPGELSVHGWVHQLLGAVVFTLMPVSCFVFWRRLRGASNWRLFRAWSVVAGAAIVADVLALKLAQRPPTEAFSWMAAWVGLFQRGALCTWLLWLFSLAAALRDIASHRIQVQSPGNGQRH